MKKDIILFLSIIIGFTSCNSDNESSMPDDGIALNPKITGSRHIHAMQKESPPLKDLDLQFDQIIVEYTTTEPDLKTPVRLTGSITLPPPVYTGRALPSSLMIYHEYTNAKRGERTSQNEVDALGILVNQFTTSIAITANLYGWTTTEDCPQAYCCVDANNRATIDFYDAALHVLDSLGYDVRDLPVVNVGYSGGGHSAMALQKYVTENRPDLHFELTAAGGTPFDVFSSYKTLVENNTTDFPCALPLIVVAYKETFGFDYPYSDIFQKPLYDHIDDWILSKNYTTFEINELIGIDKTVDEIFTPAMCDFTSPIVQNLMELMRRNSVCGTGQTWQPDPYTRYFIFHAEDDTYVHYSAGQEMAEYLTSHGCSDVKTDFGEWGGHVYYGAIAFFGKTLLEIQDIVSENDSESGQAVAAQYMPLLMQTMNAMENR